MTRKFEYFSKLVVMNDIEIEDIGECAILANNDLNHKWFLVITTELGITEIFEVGPIISDMETLPVNFKSSYKRIAYSENRISKSIDAFLNDASRGITQAMEIDKEEARPYFIGLADYIK